MGFVDQMKLDVASMLADFGETITYHPKNGDAVECLAIIDRLNDRRTPETMHGTHTPFTLIIGTTDVPTVIRDGDTVSLPPRYGGDIKVYTVKTILEQDAASWKLGVA